MKHALFCLAIVFFVAACTSGSTIVVDDSQPATEDWVSVVITDEMPNGAEGIANVRASSISRTHVISKLKQRAAEIGANAVVVVSMRSEPEIPGAEPGAMGRRELHIIEGIAIFVDQ